MVSKFFIILLVVIVPYRISLSQEPKTDLSNPAIFLGSSFGEFFQMLHKTGEYEQMLIYTSKETRNDFNDEALLKFYSNMNFSYPLKLKAFKQSTLYYKTSINATSQTIQLPVVVENDTCRIVFKALNFKNPFVGM